MQGECIVLLLSDDQRYTAFANNPKKYPSFYPPGDACTMISIVYFCFARYVVVKSLPQMRKKNQEITDPQMIEHILATSQVCRIAMVDNGLPYIVPCNYGYRDRCIYIHSAPEGRKIEVLGQNSTVCFEITEKSEIVPNQLACKWAAAYRSVIGYALAEIITDDTEKRKGLEIIMSHYGSPGPHEFEPAQVKGVVILKLTIKSYTAKHSGNLSA